MSTKLVLQSVLALGVFLMSNSTKFSCDQIFWNSIVSVLTWCAYLTVWTEAFHAADNQKYPRVMNVLSLFHIVNDFTLPRIKHKQPFILL